ncbi:MAG: type II secretion system protein GspJ [Thermodesulfobacteriota bacterium]|nr:type II secretion system protein GspJ [Thermodesulfobacteriota bacterium]
MTKSLKIQIQRRNAHAGFTLMEILVAISLSAVVFTLLFGSFNLLISNVGAVKEGISVYQAARVCMDRITEDLRSVYVTLPPAYEPPDFDDDPDPYRFLADLSYGDDAELSFVAFSHLPLGSEIPAKAGRIRYYLYETDTGGRVLMRRDAVMRVDSDEMDDGNDPVLCEHVKALRFTFYDETEREYEYWDSDSREFDYATPRAVRIELVLEKDGEAPRRFETLVALPVYRKSIEQ